MYNNVMVDIETLATKGAPVILSIGAVRFDRTGVDQKSKFYRVIDLNSYSAYEPHAFNIDLDTIKFWFKHHEKFNDLMSAEPKVKIHEALDSFIEYVKVTNSPLKIWSLGATADIVWLKNAMGSVYLNNFKAPWNYQQERCYRTLKDTFKNIKSTFLNKDTHNALSDAYSQAVHAAEILSFIEDGYNTEAENLDINPIVNM